MKRASIVLLLSIGMVGAARAQEQQPRSYSSWGRLNGRYWNHLADGPGELPRKVYSDSTFGEIVKAFDQFFADPANANIPIVMARALFARKVKGDTVKELQESIVFYRNVYHQAGSE